MLLAIVGVVLGLIGAFGLTRLMASMLFGVEPTDPVTFASIAVLSVTINWSIAMVRSQGSVGQNLARVFVEGLQLPWLTVLSKTRAQYLPWLEGHPSPLGWFALWAVMIWLLWRLERPFWRWSVPPP